LLHLRVLYGNLLLDWHLLGDMLNGDLVLHRDLVLHGHLLLVAYGDVLDRHLLILLLRGSLESSLTIARRKICCTVLGSVAAELREARAGLVRQLEGKTPLDRDVSKTGPFYQMNFRNYSK
jgi:hypothetical protein